MEQPKTVNLAILGVGTIGRAVVRLIHEQSDRIAEQTGIQLTIRYAMARSIERVKAAGLRPEQAITSAEPALADPNVDVVVEVLGGEEPAASIMHAALERGKHVVTANKEALAKHFAALSAIARANNRALLFEASVGGGIPLMASLRQILATNRVSQLRGIVNGTTNFILTQMAEHSTPYQEALQEAQRLGYAEPDPTADVEGYDAAYKLAILASLAAKKQIHPENIERVGITQVTPEEIAEARHRGGVIKLLAQATEENGTWRLRVAPEFVPGDSLLAHVRLNFNAIEVTGDRVGTVVLYGQGAGPLPTASAIVSDVLDAIRFGGALTPAIAPA